jgi:hypothetical protein
MFRRDVRIMLMVMTWGLFIVLSCKEERQGFPKIEITEPSGSVSLAVPDTLLIRGTITDDDLRTASITLLNKDYLPVDVTVNLSVQRPVTSFAVEVPVFRADIPDGDYFFRIRATNSTEYASAWIPVQLRQKPIEREGMVVSGGTGLTKRVEYFRTGLGPITLYAGPGDHRLTTAFGTEKISTIMPETTGPIRSYDLTSGQPAWQVDAQTSGGAATFTAGGSQGQNYWAGFWDGRIVRYNPQGQVSRTFFLQEGHRALQILPSENQLVVFSQTLGGGQRQILLLDQLAGFLVHDIQIGNTVTAMARVGTGMAAIALLDGNGQTRIALFDFDSGNLTQIGSPFLGVVSTMVAINSELLWMGVGQQLRQIRLNNGQISLIANHAEPIVNLDWDMADNVALYACGQTLYRHRPGQNAIALIQAPFPILGFAPVYSRTPF